MLSHFRSLYVILATLEMNSYCYYYLLITTASFIVAMAILDLIMTDYLKCATGFGLQWQRQCRNGHGNAFRWGGIENGGNYFSPFSNKWHPQRLFIYSIPYCNWNVGSFSSSQLIPRTHENFDWVYVFRYIACLSSTTIAYNKL